MKESSSEPTKDDGSCAEPRLMPTLVAPGGLIVCLEMPRMTHLGHFSDVTVLDGTLDSQLVAGAAQRFESARRLSFFSRFAGNTQRNAKAPNMMSGPIYCNPLTKGALKYHPAGWLKVVKGRRWEEGDANGSAAQHAVPATH